MAETDLTPEEAASDARLPQYNTGAYDPVTNEFGFDEDGHQVNQMRQARDAGVMGRLARRLAIFVQGLANTVAANVLLTAEDARNTGLDRIATAENVVKAAEEVTKAAAQAERLVGTSATAVATGTGSKTFATQPNKHFGVGQFLTIVSTAVVTRWMHGQVTAYNAATGALTVNVGAIGPTTGTVSSWNIYTASPQGPQGIQGIPGTTTMSYAARSANTQIVKGDSAKLFDLTGTFTQTFATPANLGADFYAILKNAGTGFITIPASDGRTDWIMYPGEMRLFQCDGTTLRSRVLEPFSEVIFTASTTIPKPPGYRFLAALAIDAGNGGTGGVSSGGRGGDGGRFRLGIVDLDTISGDQIAIEVGAGGAGGVAGGGTGGTGGVTSCSGFRQALSIQGGGGGGAGSTTVGANGASTDASGGGGGGGAYTNGTTAGRQGGVSATAGNGGNGGGSNVLATPGSAPGGGGGGGSGSGNGGSQTAGAAGARGELSLRGSI